MKLLIHFFYLVTLFICITTQTKNKKVRIFSPVFNRPDFIDIQKRTFDTFLQDEYELIIFNDAPNQSMATQIELMCKKLNLECIRVPQELHLRRPQASAGHRHMDGIQFALEKIGYGYDGIVMLIDSDMFLIKPFSINNFLDGYDAAADKQGRSDGKTLVQYFSPLIVMMDMSKLPNKQNISFEGGRVEGLNCDVGGHTYYYLKNNPSVKVKWWNLIHIGAWIQHIKCPQCINMSCGNCIQKLIDQNFNNDLITFIHACPTDTQSSLDLEFCIDNTFLHYRSGSNWRNFSNEYHATKTTALNNLLNTILPRI